jgi:3-hydroxybutyryl-CoA dehydrogenase
MKRVTVVGAGTMGHGIAQVAALAGFDVLLTDARSEVLAAALDRVRSNLEKGVARGKVAADDADAAFARLHTASDVDAAADEADLVVEAVVEDLEIKRDLFRRLDARAPEHAILASNTSSLSVAKIAEATGRPTKVLGTHFFNPVHIMRLVELVVHEDTSPETLATTRQAVERMGKDPIVAKDRPGFASSRLGIALGLEAMRMVEEGVASAEDIDKAMTLGYGHPMGPLEVSDLVGLDVRLAIADYLAHELDAARFRAPEILRGKVVSGELGKKTGRGFYTWPKNQSF